MKSVRRTRTPAPVPSSEDSATTKARRLPMPGPGIIVNVPLHLLPAYLELYGLEPIQPQRLPPLGQTPALRVRRVTSKGKSDG